MINSQSHQFALLVLSNVKGRTRIDETINNNGNTNDDDEDDDDDDNNNDDDDNDDDAAAYICET